MYVELLFDIDNMLCSYSMRSLQAVQRVCAGGDGTGSAGPGGVVAERREP